MLRRYRDGPQDYDRAHTVDLAQLRALFARGHCGKTTAKVHMY
jgi:hypothetical protein